MILSICLISIYLLIRKQVFLQIKFVINIPTSARLTKERPMHRPISPPILEIKDSVEISCNLKNNSDAILRSIYLIQKILWHKRWWYKCLYFGKIFFTVTENLFCEFSNIFCRHVCCIKYFLHSCDPIFVIKINFILLCQRFPVTYDILVLWKESYTYVL